MLTSRFEGGTINDLTRWPCDHPDITTGNDAHAPTCTKCGEDLTPVEELTPEGVQLVIPGTEKVQPVTMKQGELW